MMYIGANSFCIARSAALTRGTNQPDECFRLTDTFSVDLCATAQFMLRHADVEWFIGGAPYVDRHHATDFGFSCRSIIYLEKKL